MQGSSRQDLAALGTAAGKHLATVGSSHSLPETVNLGSVTPTGLIGTLQCNTPPVFHMLDSRMAAATHSARIYIRYGIITEITGQVNHFFLIRQILEKSGRCNPKKGVLYWSQNILAQEGTV